MNIKNAMKYILTLLLLTTLIGCDAKYNKSSHNPIKQVTYTTIKVGTSYLKVFTTPQGVKCIIYDNNGITCNFTKELK